MREVRKARLVLVMRSNGKQAGVKNPRLARPLGEQAETIGTARAPVAKALPAAVVAEIPARAATAARILASWIPAALEAAWTERARRVTKPKPA